MFLFRTSLTDLAEVYQYWTASSAALATRLGQITLAFKFLQTMPKVKVLEVFCGVGIARHIRYQSQSLTGKGKVWLITTSSWKQWI
jgi:hypothetical protein